MAELSEAQRRVLERGYCVLHLNEPRWICSDLSYKEWAAFVDAGYIQHQKSRLHHDDYPAACWERYRVTKAGRAALEQE